MYGLNKDFLIVKNNELFDGTPLVLQCEWPHVVGRILRFGNTESSEQYRRQWLQNRRTSVPYGTAEGYKLYIDLVGTLRDVKGTRIEESVGQPLNDYLQQTLDQMADFAVTQLTDKQKYSCGEDRPIVPDDYYKTLRAQRRAERQQNQTTDF